MKAVANAMETHRQYVLDLPFGTVCLIPESWEASSCCVLGKLLKRRTFKDEPH